MLRWVVLAGLMMVGGCSSFDREWGQSATQPSLAGIEGAWDGKWTSDDGHGSGSLRCLIRQIAADQYRAQFRATYWGVLRFSEDVVLQGTFADGVLKATGDADLGWVAGGVYHYEAVITPMDFHSTYRSKYENGTFEMKRPNGMK